jgi:hypothetical protein
MTLIQDPDVVIEEPRVTVKQRFLQQQHSPLSKDYFLFSCLEYERLTKDKNRSGSWPGIQSPQSASIGDNVVQLVEWHLKSQPDVATLSLVNHEACTKAVPVVVEVCRDIALLYTARTNEPLPSLTGKDLLHEAWKDIFRALRQTLGPVGAYAEDYLRWAYSNPDDEVVEPGSRPPVGRYAPPMLPRDKRGPTKPLRREFEPKGGGPAKKEKERHQSPHPKKQPPKKGGDSKGKEVALKEVEQALDRLRGEPSLSEVTLKPNNSFLRRLQHQVAVDAGFNTESTGEGPDRAVRISRA